MKTKSVFRMAFLAAFLLLNANLFSQETKQPKKALDAFITATTKIPNAKLTIEFKGKTAYCITNEKGEFAISISDPSKIFDDAPFHNAIIKVDLPKEHTQKISKKSFVIKLKKENGPFYEFVLLYNKGDNPNENELTLEEKPSTKYYSNDKNKIKREKGDASKTGDKYMGQVAHF